MTNTQYTEKIIFSVDRIWVDTSTLMSRGFHQFILNNKERFLSAEKRLIVPKAVYSELARHVSSNDPDKSDLAMAAVELLSMNKDVFHVENVPLTEEEIAHAFADAQLLSELTLHKSNCNQLLITNDRKLSCDAFDLNQQQSCKGRKILVCYINWYGEMQCCECARANNDRMSDMPISEEPIRVVPAFDIPTPIPEMGNTWEYDWKSGAISVAFVGAFYGLLRISKPLLHHIKF